MWKPYWDPFGLNLMGVGGIWVIKQGLLQPQNHLGRFCISWSNTGYYHKWRTR